MDLPITHTLSEMLSILRKVDQKMSAIDDLSVSVKSNTDAVTALAAAIAALPAEPDLSPLAAAVAQLAANTETVLKAVKELSPDVPPAA